MSGALVYVQNQILEFSLEVQLYLLAYIANNVNKKIKQNILLPKKVLFRCAQK